MHLIHLAPPFLISLTIDNVNVIVLKSNRLKIDDIALFTILICRQAKRDSSETCFYSRRTKCDDPIANNERSDLITRKVIE